MGDIFKKMFENSSNNKKSDEQSQFKDEFRKPTWFEENETDDELFDSNRKVLFQMFTNPIELQKHFDQQMKELLKSIKQYEENEGQFFDENHKETYLKPGFEENFMKEFKKTEEPLDTDLDGEIYADQLHSLLQRLSPEIRSILPGKNKKPQMIKSKPKLSDEEKIMGRIHGTIEDEERTPAVKRKDMLVPKIPQHFGGVFEGTYQGPKMFGQSVMSQTIRKPDGSYETKRIIRDTDGNIKTTVTRSIDGKTETVTTYGGDQIKTPELKTDKKSSSLILSSEPNIYVSKYGYALPKNLW